MGWRKWAARSLARHGGRHEMKPVDYLDNSLFLSCRGTCTQLRKGRWKSWWGGLAKEGHIVPRGGRALAIEESFWQWQASEGRWEAGCRGRWKSHRCLAVARLASGDAAMECGCGVGYGDGRRGCLMSVDRVLLSVEGCRRGGLWDRGHVVAGFPSYAVLFVSFPFQTMISPLGISMFALADGCIRGGGGMEVCPAGWGLREGGDAGRLA